MTGSIQRATFGRRKLLHTGGLTLSMGAIIAACGEDRAGGTEPGRVGNAPDVSALAEGEVDDVVLLRTAQSLEYTAIDAYAAARALDVLSAEQDTLVQRFVDDHTEHSVAVGGLITAAGGEEFACANPWMQRRVIDPIFDAIDGSDDMLRDVLNIVQRARIAPRRVLPVVRRLAHGAGPADEDDADRGRREPPRGNDCADDHRHARRVREPGDAR